MRPKILNKTRLRAAILDAARRHYNTTKPVITRISDDVFTACEESVNKAVADMIVRHQRTRKTLRRF